MTPRWQVRILAAFGAAICLLGAVAYVNHRHHGAKGAPGPAGSPGPRGPVATPSFTPQPGSSPVMVNPPPSVIVVSPVPGSTRTVTQRPTSKPPTARPSPTSRPTPKPSPVCLILVCLKERSLSWPLGG